MPNRPYFSYFMWVALMLGILSVVVLAFHESVKDVLLGESGLIEQASAVGYFACALFMLIRGGREFIQRRGYFIVLIVLFGCRELDFDKAFTTLGILKSRFYVSPDIPWGERMIGILVLAVLLWSLVCIVRGHFRDFLSGLRERSVEGVGVALVIVLLIVSKSIDGLPRKLQPFGVEVSADAAQIFGNLEEVMELGIPIYMALVAHSVLARERV